MLTDHSQQTHPLPQEKDGSEKLKFIPTGDLLGVYWRTPVALCGGPGGGMT